MLATFLETAELANVFREHGVRQTFKKGDFIIHPGETPPGVFYIYEGYVKAFVLTKFNEENLLIIRKPEEIFPLTWGLTGKDRPLGYQALTPTVTWRISPATLLNYVNDHPEAYAPLLDMSIEMFRVYRDLILSLEYRSVRERLISFLLVMGERFGKRAEGGLLLEVPLRHQDIASSINATRETTSRELGGLERKELLANKQSLILLKDVKTLKSYLK